MYNVYKNPVLITVVFAFLSCSDGNKEQEAAQARLDYADSLITQGNYTLALSELDSIEAMYPKMIDVRRRAHDLRPKAIEQLTMRQIQSADSLIAVTQQGIAELEGGFKHIGGEDLEGYYLPDGFKANAFTNTTSIQPRVNDADFRFYIVASNNGKYLKINRVSYLIGGNEFASDAIPAGSERSSRLEGSEIATFLPEEVDSIGRISANAGSPITGAVIIGENGRQKVAVTPAQSNALINAWRYGNLRQQLRSALILREKLDRQLQTSRDQLANRIQE